MANTALNLTRPRAHDLDTVYLNIGDVFFGAGQHCVRTVLGSCVGIAIWHPVRRMGGLCHILTADAREPGVSGFDAAGAVHLLAQHVAQANTAPGEYIVKLFGGANMFPNVLSTCASDCGGNPTARQSARCTSIGCRNISAARQRLQEAGFRLAVEDVGGSLSRDVILDLANGDVWVRHIKTRDMPRRLTLVSK